MEGCGPNAEQERYWNETAGPTWVALGDLLDRMIGPLGRAAMDRAALVPGERVVDVGCGCGDSTLELARCVGPAGAALGVDLSAPMLAVAAERARAAGLPQIRFEQADAQTHAFPPAAFDVLYSRFGVMFFSDPVAAFTNLGRALRPGGRLAFVCWRPLAANPWMSVPLGAAARVIPLPPPPVPDAPGPFSFGDGDRVLRILQGAGFADVVIDRHDDTLLLGAGVDQAVERVLRIGPAAAALREAADPTVRPRVAEAVRAALAPHATAEGVRMACAAWIVTAR
jgi:SAM-dependent methyltransferase